MSARGLPRDEREPGTDGQHAGDELRTEAGGVRFRRVCSRTQPRGSTRRGLRIRVRGVAIIRRPAARVTGGQRTSAAAPSLPEFVALRGQSLLRLAWLLTGDPDHAQDAVQEALARVLPRWDGVCGKGDPEPYVRAAVRSVCIDAHRRRSVRPREEQVPDDGGRLERESRLGSGSADEAEAAAERLDLGSALARLTPRQREVLVLRFYEDLTEAAAATGLGCSVSTVKSQTRHALERLRVLAPDLLTGLRETREVSS